jgi:hypothetical protein
MINPFFIHFKLKLRHSSHNQSIMGRYMNFEILKVLHSKSNPIVGKFTFYIIVNSQVKCFFNMSWWVCPDPMDKETISILESDYRKGMFVKIQEFRITRVDYDDVRNWNDS